MYATGLPEFHRNRAVQVAGRLPFVFEASGSETHFTNGFDPEPRARSLVAFPQPETPARIVRAAADDPANPTWRAKVRHLLPLDVTGLRDAQAEAIHGVEKSLAEQRYARSLVQMAVEFPIPPLPEQTGIVQLAATRLDAVEVMHHQIGAAGRRSSSLRRAMLAAAFSGRLTGRSSDLEIAEELMPA